MADAQDLKSWDHKKSCRFESGHRHHTFEKSRRFHFRTPYRNQKQSLVMDAKEVAQEMSTEETFLHQTFDIFQM